MKTLPANRAEIRVKSLVGGVQRRPRMDDINISTVLGPSSDHIPVDAGISVDVKSHGLWCCFRVVEQVRTDEWLSSTCSRTTL